jgi:transcription elongation factor Elf1
MAHGLPIHIVHEIERRWQRRLDARPPERPGKNADRGAGRCPLCGAASIAPATPENAFPIGDLVCSACGHAWREEAR